MQGQCPVLALCRHRNALSRCPFSGGVFNRSNSKEQPSCPLLMLWTAPAPWHRSAVDWLRQNQSDSQGGETRQQRRRLKFEGIGEDRRGNADKVDLGIGRTRLGQRI